MPTSTIAAISSVVATGRRMNGADGLMRCDQSARRRRGRQAADGTTNALLEGGRRPARGSWSRESRGWWACAHHDDRGQRRGRRGRATTKGHDGGRGRATTGSTREGNDGGQRRGR